MGEGFIGAESLGHLDKGQGSSRHCGWCSWVEPKLNSWLPCEGTRRVLAVSSELAAHSG